MSGVYIASIFHLKFFSSFYPFKGFGGFMAFAECWNAFHLLRAGLSSSMCDARQVRPDAESFVRKTIPLLLDFVGENGFFQEEALLRLGWCFCPVQGMNSCAYISPCGNYVLRVGGPKDAYCCHAMMAILYPENPYLQKVYAHFVSVSGYCNFTLMERLYDVSDCNIALRDAICRAIPFSERRIRYDALSLDGDAHLKTLFCKIERFFKLFTWCLSDVKWDNFMQRFDGQLVMIDSLHGLSSYTDFNDTI